MRELGLDRADPPVGQREPAGPLARGGGGHPARGRARAPLPRRRRLPPCGRRSAAGSACRPTQIVVGNGADELIGMVALAAFDPGDEVVVPTPSFEPYATSVDAGRRAGAPEPAAPATTPTWTTCWRRVTPRTKAVILCSPHNPATTIVRRAPLDALPRRARRRSAARRPRRGLLRLLRRSRVPRRHRAARALPAACSCCARSRRSPRWPGCAWATRSARRVHRPPQPRPRAVQRQPARPGGGAGRARRSRALGAHAARGARGARVPLARSWRKRGLTFPPSQANFFLVKVAGATALRGSAAAGRVGRARRRRRRLPRPPAHLDRHSRRPTRRLLRVFDGA